MEFQNPFDAIRKQAQTTQVKELSISLSFTLFVIVLILIFVVIDKFQKNEELKDNLSQAKSSEKSLKAEIIRLQKQAENKKDEKA
jgi:uncharacterized transporter YbjL